jgi:phosphoglycolate phosphatase
MPGPAANHRTAIVFDLDGTLIDSAPDLQAALNRVLEGIGRRPLELAEATRMIGDGVNKLVERALAATGGVPAAGAVADLAGWVSHFVDEYKGRGTELTRPYPGVEATLALLKAKGYRLGVCTNKPHAASEEVLAMLGLAPLFDAVLGGGALPEAERKPDPRHLLRVIEALGATPAEAVMVGDLPNDVNMARAAGVPVVFCAFGYHPGDGAELAPEATIERFDALPAALARLA